MSLDLVVPTPISSTPTQVSDQNGDGSALYLGTNQAAIQGNPTGAGQILGVFGNSPAANAHVQLGQGTATSGKVSAKLTLAGYNVQHSGFAWTPNSDASKGILQLAFGGSNDPTQNAVQYTFQSNGDLTVNGTLRAGGLAITGSLTLPGNNLVISGLTTPPAGVATVDLVVDPKTGRIYRQS